MTRVVRLRRSTVIVILMTMFGMLGALAWAVLDLRSLHSFDSRRNYDICIGANRRIEAIVLKLTERSDPERRDQFLRLVQETNNDCNVYKKAS